jgi:hypothetical protein
MTLLVPRQRASRVASLIATMGALALGASLAPSALAQTKQEIITASQKGVNFIINDSKRAEVNSCFSCHNTGQAIRTGLMAEKSVDLTVDATQLNRMIGFINNQQFAASGAIAYYDGAITHEGNATAFRHHPNTTSSWALYSLIGADSSIPGTAYNQARFLRGAGYLARVINGNAAGMVPHDHDHVPVDSGNPGETARSIAVLARAQQIDGAAHWSTSIAKATAYLRTVDPRNAPDYYIQDISWLIMGLTSGGVAPTDTKVAGLVATLKARRNTINGGWSRNTTSSVLGASDAFATGVALNALLAVGEKNSVNYPELQAGIRYLLNTQEIDGGWPSNISRVSGSTWAVLSLTELAAAPPVITVPADITAEAASAAGASVTFSVTVVDEIDGAITPTLSHASGSTFPFGTTRVTASATNKSGINASKSFNITVVDTTKPVITAPANLTLEATSPQGAVATFAASATDNISGSVPVSAAPPSGSTFAIGLTGVTLTAKDASNNTGMALFHVRVQDTTKPTIAAQGDIVVEATGASGAVVTFSPSATDLASTVTVSAAPASGSVFALGTTTVAISARDAFNNTATSNFNVTVQDTFAPKIATLSDITAEATSAAGAVVTFSPTATDLVTSNVAISASPAAGSTFPLGTTPVTVTATDAAGNSSTSTFNVIVKDTVAPVLTTPSSQTLEATGPAGASATFAASATDATGATLTYSHASGATFGLGATQVSVTARDAAGNESAGTFTITVRDTTKPALTLPSDLTLEATSASGALASFAISANDVVTASPTLNISHASGSTFPIGATAVTVSATDAAGNVATGSFNVTVRDTTAPAITPLANLTLEATSAAGAATTFTPSATDAVGLTSLTSSHASGSTFAIGTTIVTITAKDAANNTSTATFTVTVRDTVAPAIATLANQTLEATNAQGAIATFVPSATDTVGVTSLTSSHASGSRFPIGTTTVTLTAQDAANNVSTATFTITVKDTTAPTFSSLTASSGSLWPANHKLVAITLTPTASDTVGIASLKIVSATSNEPDNGLGDGDTANDIQITGPLALNLRAERAGGGNGRIYTIVVEARDAAGNATTRTVTIAVPKSQGGR